MATINSEIFFRQNVDGMFEKVGPRKYLYFCYDAAKELFTCLIGNDTIYNLQMSPAFAKEVLEYLQNKKDKDIKVATLRSVADSYEARYLNPAYFRE